jgi:hypothetical protein
MMTQLSQESASLSQHNMSVTEALRSIQLDTSLSHQGLRAAIDGVLAMVSSFLDDLCLLTPSRPSPLNHQALRAAPLSLRADHLLSLVSARLAVSPKMMLR